MFDNKISHVLSRFRWVVCQLETLRRSVQRDVRGILSKLPKTLDETYERVLRDIHEDNKEHARRLLHCIAVAVRPLRVEELAEILMFDFDAAEGAMPEYHADRRRKDHEEAVLSTCSSLIAIAEHDDGFYGSRRRVVQFSHFSVKEFLMSNRLATPIRDVSRYHILPEPAHSILAQACLGFLLHLDAPIDAAIVENFPLAQYATEHWVTHAQFQDVASHVECGMRDFFDPHKPYFTSWIGMHDMDFGPFHECVRLSTPVYYSALCGFYDLVQHFAIKFPHDVNTICGRCDFPLVAALSQGHVSVAEVLLEYGGNVNARGTGGRSPLHTLLDCREDVSKDNLNHGVRLLLERGANVNAPDMTHETPLHLIMRQNDSSDITRILLEHGADPNLRNDDGEAPLHVLSEPHIPDRDLRRSADCILSAKLLLEQGADVNSRDKDRVTPLLLAMRLGTSDLARILLEHDADPDSESQHGNTPLHILLGSSKAHRDPPFVQYHDPDYIIAASQLLLERGANVNSRDKDHETPLLLAVRYESPDLVRFLLKHGADPNLENKDGKTPLHRLLGPRNRDDYPLFTPANHYPADYVHVVAQSLLERGADVNARDKCHKTPLLLAVPYESPDLVCFLLEHGAKPNMEDSEGNTPLHTLLLERDNDSKNDVLILRLLLKHGADAGARNKEHATPLDLAPYYRKVPKGLIAEVLLSHTNGLESAYYPNNILIAELPTFY